MEQIERITSLETKTENLIDWQKNQNGCLLRLEKKMDNLHQLVIGLMGGIITTLVLLVLNLALKI